MNTALNPPDPVAGPERRPYRPQPYRRLPARLMAIASAALLAMSGLLLATPALAPPAHGTLITPAERSSSASPASSAQSAGGEEGLQPVVVVMDYSSSMLEADADGDGTTRLAAAQQATNNLLDNAPEDSELGLVVYGSTTAGDCQDISTLQPVGPTDVGALKEKIGGLDAVGETPIGASLLHAADELEGIDGDKSIILVSDGEENCSEPPACEAAQSLADQGIGLTVHTIGFKVNDKAREELTCVAEATGGSYVQADNAAELETELQTKTVRAFQGYVASGTPVSGGESLHTSPGIAPGQYLDEYARGETEAHTSEDGTLKFYDLGTIEPGERAHFSALLLPDQSQGRGEDNPFAGVEVQLVNGQGTSCSNRADDYEHSSHGGEPIVGYVRSEEYTESKSYGCFADGTGRLYAKVQRYGERQADQALPVELKLVIEPPVDESQLGPHADEEESVQSVTLDDPAAPVLGGSGFNDATELEAQSVLSDSVMPNEARYYRVHVGYGQRLNVRAANGATKEAGPNQVNLRVFSSVRGPVDMIGDHSLYRNDPGDTITRNMQVAVSRNNFDGYYGEDAYLSGDYYVVVSADTWSDDRNREPYPYELAVDVTGEEQDGPLVAEPGDGQVVSDQTGQGADDAADGGETDASAAGDGTEAQEPDGAEDADAASAAGPSESAGDHPLPWFLGGLVGAAVIGAATLMLTRRTAATATTQQYPGTEGPR